MVFNMNMEDDNLSNDNSLTNLKDISDFNENNEVNLSKRVVDGISKQEISGKLRTTTDTLENERDSNIFKDSSSSPLTLVSNSLLRYNNVSDESDEEIIINRSRSKKVALDSDDDGDIFQSSSRDQLPSMENEITDLMKKEKHKSRILMQSDSDESENEKELPQYSPKPTKIHYNPDLFDTQSTDGDRSSGDEEECMGQQSPIKQQTISEQKSKTKKEAKKSKKTIKENEDRMLEIHSTSQKLIRESTISLPYHIPKQRTLTEFLNRKKHTPESSDRRRSLKMTMKDLSYLREIEERAKEVDDFYKSASDSDHGDDDDSDWQPRNDQNSPKQPEKEANTINSQNPPTSATELDGEEKMDNNKTNQDDLITNIPDKADKTDVSSAEVENSVAIHNKTNSDDADKEILSQGKSSGCLNGETSNITAGKSIDSDIGTNSQNASSLISSFSQSDSGFNSENRNDIRINESAALSMDSEEIENDKSVDGSRSQTDPVLEDARECVESMHVNDYEISKTDTCEDSQDSQSGLRLHMSTEDFLAFNATEEIEKSPNKHESKNTTPKMALLASKFPNLKLESLSCSKPRLSFGNDGFVDLEKAPSEKEKGVEELLNRFIKHKSAKIKKPAPDTVVLGIVSKEFSKDGEENLVHSSLSVKAHQPEEKVSEKEAAPGAQLAKLKSCLKAKLLQQRAKECQRRIKEKEFMDSEKVIRDYNDDGLPDEEEFDDPVEASDASQSGESEPEENDVVIRDAKRTRNRYVDDEADETDPEEDGANGERTGDEAESENEIDDDNDENDEDANDSDVSNSEEDDDQHKINSSKLCRKKQNRISDDDDEEESDLNNDDDDQNHGESEKNSAENLPEEEVTAEEKGNKIEDMRLLLEDTQEAQDCFSVSKNPSSTFPRTHTEDMFASQLATQPSSDFDKKKDGVEDVAESQGGAFSFSDFSQSFARGQSGRKSATSSNGNVAENAELDDSMNSSALTFSKIDQSVEKGLSQDRCNSLSTQSAMNFLFSPDKDFESNVAADNSQTELNPVSKKLLFNAPLLGGCKSTPNLPESEDMDNILGLCSGQFTTQQNKKRLERFDSENSQFGMVPLPASPIFQSRKEAKSKTSEEHEANSNDGRRVAHVYSSDEEGIAARQKTQRKKKKKRKRIVTLSDGEEGSDDDNESLASSLESLESDEETPPKFTSFKDDVRGGIRSEFLEKEAELSGSEADSDDEEEPNEEQDQMEWEEGDLEKFDEEDLRNQVGRAHMKSLIDKDKREIRLLQEMYLEDGDLHGEGRQRKFRWKNIDSVGADENRGADSDNEEGNGEKEDDLEEESEWRKQRIEREKFLKENQKKNEISTSPSPLKLVTPSSGRIKTSVKLSRTLSAPSAAHNNPLQALNADPSRVSPFSLFFSQDTSVKRGSFLSRDPRSLQRLAEMTKENSQTVGGAKQGGNFVFKTLTEEEAAGRVKREAAKATKDAPPAKKSRIERSFFSLEEDSRSQSVFSHL